MNKLDINQVYNGDSNLMIKSIESESVDLVIIDPPYKIRKKTDEINSLRNTVEYWKDKFDKLISFLYSKLHNWYDKDDKYIDVVNDMYKDNILDDDDIKDLKLSKEKDDFER